MVRVDGSGDGNSLIQVRDLDKKYVRGSEEIDVLQGLHLDVDQGDFVAFMGPSGSGKTTLLNLLGGLDVPSAGSITVAGDEIMDLISRLVREYGKTVLLVTHDPRVAERAGVVLHLEKGVLVEAAATRTGA